MGRPAEIDVVYWLEASSSAIELQPRMVASRNCIKIFGDRFGCVAGYAPRFVALTALAAGVLTAGGVLTTTTGAGGRGGMHRCAFPTSVMFTPHMLQSVMVPP